MKIVVWCKEQKTAIVPCGKSLHLCGCISACIPMINYLRDHN